MTILIIFAIAIISWLALWLIPGLPWFSPVIFAGLAGLTTAQLKVRSFLAGFFGVGLYWLITALVLSVRNGGLLAEKMSGVFTESLGITFTPAILLAMAALIGGLLGGLAAWGGRLMTFNSESFSRMRRRKKHQRRQSYKIKLR